MTNGDRAAARLVRVSRAGHHKQARYSRPVETWDVELATARQAIRLQGCVAVVAAGSNAAPEQIARKWFGRGSPNRIAVVPATLTGLASLYSAHITSYGSVPATLHPVPGARSRLHVLFIPTGELARLDETESIGRNYLVARLDGMYAQTPAGRVPAPLAYVSKRGVLIDRVGPVALAACRAHMMPYHALDQRRMLEAVVKRMGEKVGFEQFVTALAADPEFRDYTIACLATNARLWRPPETSVLSG